MNTTFQKRPAAAALIFPEISDRQVVIPGVGMGVGFRESTKSLLRKASAVVGSSEFVVQRGWLYRDDFACVDQLWLAL